MPRQVLDRIRVAVLSLQYDMTSHAVEEMAEDELDLWDVEAAILTGKVVRTQRGDPRGTKYTVHGTAADGTTPVATVGRFAGGGRYLIITVHEVTE